MLELRQLEVLQAIDDNHSLAAAARALQVGQPTIAHHLTALERHVRARLVDKTPRGATLSPIGERFLSHARLVLERVDIAEREVADYRDFGLRILRIGTFSTAGAQMLPGALRELTTGNDVRIELHEGEPAELVRQLRDGRLHCALIYDLATDPAFDSADLSAAVLGEEPFHVVLPADHPVAGSGGGLADLEDAGWLRPRNPQEASDRALTAACAAAGFEPRTLMQTDDYHLIHGFIAAGLGAALIVESAIDTSRHVAIADVDADLGARRTAFVAPRGADFPLVARLRTILRRGTA